MAIKSLSQDLLSNSLEAINILPGDNLLIHSAIQFLGFPVGGLKMIYESLLSLVTAQGTLAVPVFTFEFANGLEYHPATSASKNMGIFSEFIRKLPGSQRTAHPMQSLAIVGHYATELASRDTPGAFDNGSAFERMLDLDFKCLLLGATINACSIIHYSEQRAKVPYRYWKNFSGLIDGQEKTYRMYARKLELDPQLDLSPIQQRLEAEVLWHSTQVNYGKIAVFTLKDFRKVADSLLAKDPFALLSNRAGVVSKLS